MSRQSPLPLLPAVRAALAALLLAFALALAACSDSPTAQERAQQDWEDQIGTAWDAYTGGYKRGWSTGCSAAASRIMDREPELPVSVLPLCGIELAPASSETDVPLTVPGDPEGDGYEQGLYDGCFHTLSDFQEDGSVCPLSAK